ncbi:hypothetical protein AgCh_034074 [Apium graveolens]
MADVCRPPMGINIKELESGIFLFRFYHGEGMNWVLKGGPWSFDNAMIMMEEVLNGKEALMFRYDIKNNTGIWKEFMRIRVRVDVPLKRKKLMKKNGVESGAFPLDLKDINIVLIPKKENADEMKDLRPIELSNVLYKVITKVLANRLKVIMPGVGGSLC